MDRPKLGIMFDQDASLRPGRTDDPVDFVVLRSCFINQPRAAGARSLASRIARVHPMAELIPYAWHYVTHEHGDVSFDRGKRVPEGEPSGFGHLKTTREVDRVWDIVCAAATEMGAKRVVLHTPPSFSPGAVSRRRLETFVVAHRNVQLLWQPTGLWTAAEAVAIAQPLGIEVVGPPLPANGRPDPDAPGAWIAVPGERDGRLGGARAEILADALSCLEAGAPPVVFSGIRAHTNLREFMREWDQLDPGL